MPNQRQRVSLFANSMVWIVVCSVQEGPFRSVVLQASQLSGSKYGLMEHDD